MDGLADPPARLVAEAPPAMLADVVHRRDVVRAGAGADDQDRVVEDVVDDEVARGRELGLAARHLPHARPEALPLEAVELAIVVQGHRVLFARASPARQPRALRHRAHCRRRRVLRLELSLAAAHGRRVLQHGAAELEALEVEAVAGREVVRRRVSGHSTTYCFAATAQDLLTAARLDPAELSAIGVSAPGPLDPARGVVRDAPNLPGWHEVPISAQLARALGRPVRLENDANAAALAEWRFGAGRGSRAFMFVTMSTGVGAGLILDGRLYRGARYGAGEVGHMPVVPNGRECACGLRGCLEAYTGGAALAARMRADVAAGARTSLLERAGGDPARLSAKLWLEAVRAGDSYALALSEEYLDVLAQGLAIMVLSLDLDCIALGTIVARNADLLLEPLRARVAARLWPHLRDTRIVPIELGERLSAYAGLCTALLALESPLPSSA